MEVCVQINQNTGPLGEQFTLGPVLLAHPLLAYVHSAHAGVFFFFFGKFERFAFAIAVLRASLVVNILRSSQFVAAIAGLNFRYGLKPVESPPASWSAHLLPSR